MVNFIGDKSHARLPLGKIEKFIENLKSHSKTSKKDLSSAIQIAKRIFNKEITYESHLKNDNKEENNSHKDSNFSQISNSFSSNHKEVQSRNLSPLKIGTEEESYHSDQSIKKPSKKTRGIN